MEKKAISGIMLTLLLISMLTLTLNIQLVKAEPRTWTVDDDGPADFHTIQEAINAASLGDTIYVRTGTYYENVVLEKTVTLIGENKETTIIDGGGAGIVAKVTKDNVSITGFMIRNGGKYWPDSGIVLSYVRNCNISGNNIANNYAGIWLHNSSNNNIAGNFITANIWGVFLYYYSSGNSVTGNNITANNEYGIYLDFQSSNNKMAGNSITAHRFFGIMVGYSPRNTITGNNIANNLYGINLYYYSSDNKIYHNNFVANFYQALCTESINVWDDGYPSGGNYWSDYIAKGGYDADGDGIGDIPYAIDAFNRDNYPLMEPWTPNPAEAIPELIETITNLNLPRGTENSLTSKLKDAIHLLDIGNENGAIHKLMDFISQIEALQAKKLTIEQANYLTSEAQRIINLIKE